MEIGSPNKPQELLNSPAGDIPKKGINHSGYWFEDKKDERGDLITLAHPNARYTIRISARGLNLTNHMKFGEKLKNCKKIFATNCFLKNEDKYTTRKWTSVAAMG